MKKIFYLGFIMIFGFVLVSCDTTQANAVQLNATGETSPTFTLEELSQYTGANGSTAYIAVDGIIYDVTNAFDNGTHQGMQIAGTDATAVFASSPHTAALLSTLPIVGTLDTNPVVTTTQGTTTTTTQTTTVGTTTQVPSTTQITLPVFTLTELATYTGVEGTTAYIAVNGVVYDVTNAFISGTHQGMQVGGTDATALFATSPHAPSLLNTLTVVGSLEGYDVIVISSTDTTTTSTSTQTTNDDCDDDDYDDEDDDDDEEIEIEIED